MTQLIIKDHWKLLFLPNFSGFWNNSYTEGDSCIFCFCHTLTLVGSEEQEDMHKLHWAASVHDNTGKVLWDPLWMHAMLLMRNLPEVKQLSGPTGATGGSLRIANDASKAKGYLLGPDFILGMCIYTHLSFIFILLWVIYYQLILFASLKLVWHTHILWVYVCVWSQLEEGPTSLFHDCQIATPGWWKMGRLIHNFGNKENFPRNSVFQENP